MGKWSNPLIKPKSPVKVPAGNWVDLAEINLPEGYRYIVTLQVRMPKDCPSGEAHIGRVGWGTVTGSEIDETGHNPILPASAIEAWRTPVHHGMQGGGKVRLRVYLVGAAGKSYSVRFVAKVTRLANPT